MPQHPLGEAQQGLPSTRPACCPFAALQPLPTCAAMQTTCDSNLHDLPAARPAARAARASPARPGWRQQTSRTGAPGTSWRPARSIVTACCSVASWPQAAAAACRAVGSSAERNKSSCKPFHSNRAVRNINATAEAHLGARAHGEGLVVVVVAAGAVVEHVGACREGVEVRICCDRCTGLWKQACCHWGSDTESWALQAMAAAHQEWRPHVLWSSVRTHGKHGGGCWAACNSPL